MVKLCPALRVRSDLLSIFPYLQKCSATDGASIVWGKSRQVFARKLAGKNAKEGIFSRFPGFRIYCRTSSAMEGASFVCRKQLASFRQKTCGVKNCKEAIFYTTPFQSGLGWWARTGFKLAKMERQAANTTRQSQDRPCLFL